MESFVFAVKSQVIMVQGVQITIFASEIMAVLPSRILMMLDAFWSFYLETSNTVFFSKKYGNIH